MVEPIKPEDIVEKSAEYKKASMPDGVIEAFNELIGKNWSGNSAKVTQNEAIDLIIEKVERTSRRKIIDNHWLDVEDIFREQGWKVSYDKPGYCEDYEAYFIFSK